jgi:drug/metabolite transporter (DMT)-like permease
MMALTLFFSLIPPTEYRAETELQALVCGFLCVVGAASLFGGYWLFANGERAPRYNAVVAAFFTGFGVLLIVLVFMITIGPWRHREPPVFPARIVGPYAGLSETDRGGPPLPSPGAALRIRDALAGSQGVSPTP